MGSLYIIVLHIGLALALDLALGAMRLILLVTALGNGMIGDCLAAFGMIMTLMILLVASAQHAQSNWK